MSDFELEPCPFCGSGAAIAYGGFGESYPSCTNDQCGCRFQGGIWVTEKDLHKIVEKWNTRVTKIRYERKEAGDE